MRLLKAAALAASSSITAALLVTTASGAAGEPVAPVATDASIRIVLIEDLDENGAIDADDGVPSQTVAILSLFTDEVAGNIVLYTAPDGSLSFNHIPSGDYVMRVSWAGGFVEPPAAGAHPHFIDVVFRVEPDGSIGAPAPLPEYWPAPSRIAPRRFDPVADAVVLGAPPPQILLARKDPGLLPYGTDVEFSAIAVATGSIDVQRALLPATDAPEVRLPPTGGRESATSSESLLMAVVLMALGVWSLLLSLAVRR